MEQRTMVITGASDGIGAAAAKLLAGPQSKLILIGRSPEKTKSVAVCVGASYKVCDFSRLEEVANLGEELRAENEKIDVLANNAGGIMGERTLTGDGFEKTFQVNHLAPFLLTLALLEKLKKSKGVVIQTSSIAAERYGHIRLDDLQNQTNYTANKAYGNAKLANILFTKELYRRFGDEGVSAVCFHPGYVATSFATDTNSWFRFIYQTPLRHLVLISPMEGAKRLEWLINQTPGIGWTQAEYYEYKKIVRTNPQANDPALAIRLWDQSESLVQPWLKRL